MPVGPGLMPSPQTVPQIDLHWTASDSYSTGNSTSSSVGNLPSMMDEDPQSVMPTVHQQQQNQLPPRSTGLSHSSSAPDLRLLLATELPDTRPLYMPVPGSYAGALVPYKGPEVCPQLLSWQCVLADVALGSASVVQLCYCHWYCRVICCTDRGWAHGVSSHNTV